MQISLAYLQGYRIANKVLPYVKVSVSSFDINNEAIPSRYAVIENSELLVLELVAVYEQTYSDNFDAGIEYNQYTFERKR